MGGGGSTISRFEPERLCDEPVLVRPLFDPSRVTHRSASGRGRSNTCIPLLGRLPRAVSGLLVDADQKRMGVVGLEMLQRRGVLE